MISREQRQKLESMTKEGLQKQRSVCFDKPYIIEYIDELLERPEPESAIVEMGDLSDVEGNGGLR